MNLPNRLTVARFFLALAFVGLMSVPAISLHIIAYALFTAATITDYYDGKIARERNLVTNFGKLFDPVADKVLIVGAFVMLKDVQGLNIPGWAIVAVITREILITGTRSLAATGGNVIAANRWGKRKAVLQMVYVFVFLFFSILGRILETVTETAPRIADIMPVYWRWLDLLSFWSIVFVALVTVYSGVQFLRANWGPLKLESGL